MSIAQDLPNPRRGVGPRTRAESLSRTAGAAVLVACAVLVVSFQASIRNGEASVAGGWFRAVLAGGARSTRDVVYFSWPGGAVGMRISLGCTVALLLAPVALIGAGLLVLSRASWLRIAAAITTGVLAVIVVNQLRIGLIAFAMQHWGRTGFDVSHQLVGTVFALVGFAAAVAAMVKIAAHTPEGGHRETRA